MEASHVEDPQTHKTPIWKKKTTTTRRIASIIKVTSGVKRALRPCFPMSSFPCDPWAFFVPLYFFLFFFLVALFLVVRTQSLREVHSNTRCSESENSQKQAQNGFLLIWGHGYIVIFHRPWWDSYAYQLSTYATFTLFVLSKKKNRSRGRWSTSFSPIFHITFHICKSIFMIHSHCFIIPKDQCCCWRHTLNKAWCPWAEITLKMTKKVAFFWNGSNTS